MSLGSWSSLLFQVKPAQPPATNPGAHARIHCQCAPAARTPMRPAAQARTALKDPVNLSSGRDLYLFEQDVGCAEAITHFRHAHGELGKRLAQNY